MNQESLCVCILTVRKAPDYNCGQFLDAWLATSKQQYWENGKGEQGSMKMYHGVSSCQKIVRKSSFVQFSKRHLQGRAQKDFHLALPSLGLN